MFTVCGNFLCCSADKQINTGYHVTSLAPWCRQKFLN